MPCIRHSVSHIWNEERNLIPELLNIFPALLGWLPSSPKSSNRMLGTETSRNLRDLVTITKLLLLRNFYLSYAMNDTIEKKVVLRA